MLEEFTLDTIALAFKACAMKSSVEYARSHQLFIKDC